MPHPHRTKTITCQECGKPVTIPLSQSDKRRFCSYKCFYIWLERFERADYVDVFCMNCNKPMHVIKSRYNDGRGKYCSQKCMIAKRPHKPLCKKIKRICVHCGKEFEVYPSWCKGNGGRFCSRSCVGAHTMKTARENSPTKIEKSIARELRKRKIKFSQEYAMTGWTIDFAFPDHKLAVEADGSYWHGLENVIEKDKRKDADMKKRGWTILHFGEDEINNDVGLCVDVIEKHLKS